MKEENTVCDTSRRSLIKNSAMIAGVATITPAISFAKGDANKAGQLGAGQNLKAGSVVKADQHRYIVSVLNKYAAKSKRVTAGHIDRFAKGFIEMNGDIDYKQTFNKLDGEYKLVKLFMKSLNASV